jgi:hypothetical protein
VIALSGMNVEEPASACCSLDQVGLGDFSQPALTRMRLAGSITSSPKRCYLRLEFIDLPEPVGISTTGE